MKKALENLLLKNNMPKNINVIVSPHTQVSSSVLRYIVISLLMFFVSCGVYAITENTAASVSSRVAGRVTSFTVNRSVGMAVVATQAGASRLAAGTGGTLTVVSGNVVMRVAPIQVINGVATFVLGENPITLAINLATGDPESVGNSIVTGILAPYQGSASEITVNVAQRFVEAVGTAANPLQTALNMAGVSSPTLDLAFAAINIVNPMFCLQAAINFVRDPEGTILGAVDTVVGAAHEVANFATDLGNAFATAAGIFGGGDDSARREQYIAARRAENTRVMNAFDDNIRILQDLENAERQRQVANGTLSPSIARRQARGGGPASQLRSQVTALVNQRDDPSVLPDINARFPGGFPIVSQDVLDRETAILRLQNEAARRVGILRDQAEMTIQNAIRQVQEEARRQTQIRHALICALELNCNVSDEWVTLLSTNGYGKFVPNGRGLPNDTRLAISTATQCMLDDTCTLTQTQLNLLVEYDIMTPVESEVIPAACAPNDLICRAVEGGRDPRSECRSVGRACPTVIREAFDDYYVRHGVCQIYDSECRDKKDRIENDIRRGRDPEGNCRNLGAVCQIWIREAYEELGVCPPGSTACSIPIVQSTAALQADISGGVSSVVS